MNNRINISRLIKTAVIKFTAVFTFICLLIFLPAWSFRFWNGWLLIIALLIPVLLVFIYLIRNDPELLHKRLQGKEKEPVQKNIIALSVIPLILTYIIPGLDYRFHWSNVPLWLVILSVLIWEIGYFIFFLVLRQNSYASRIIEVQEKQRVIDTGLYSFVRHPMYLAILLLYLSAPLVLGSFYALLPLSILILVFKRRIQNEEEVLKKGLEGYTDYVKKVKYKLFPYIW